MDIAEGQNSLAHDRREVAPRTGYPSKETAPLATDGEV